MTQTTKTLNVQIGGLNAKLTSDVYDGEVLDTKVELSGGFLCCIAGEDIDKFTEELSNLIQRYSI